MAQIPTFLENLTQREQLEKLLPGGFRGWLSRVILGTGAGKFKPSQNRYYPLQQRAILIDTSPGELMSIAMEVPHLNTVISTGAELFSMMRIKHVDKEGNEIENSDVLKFLRRPNALQSLEQYLYEFYVLNAVYNKTFQHQIKGLSFERIPSAMWLLPSGYMKINTTGKLYRQTDIKEIISSYEMYTDSTPFAVDRVIYMAEGIGDSILNPISRIEALQIPLSNIVASLKSRNIIVSERGMIGFVTPDSQSNDGDGALPLSDEEHKRVREEYQRQYSLDGLSGHVSFPKIPMKWVPMTFNIKDLALIEGVEDDFAAVIGAYRHDRDIYPSVKGATFENKAAGMKSTIQNGIQPLADKLLSQWTENFIDVAKGERLEACYNHLPAMKEDERIEAQGKLYTTQAASIMLEDAVISHEQYAELCDVKMDGDKQPKQRKPYPNAQTAQQ